jgi:superfamily I DNA and/or RNA helicase
VSLGIELMQQVKHEGKGYDNPAEVLAVVAEAKAALSFGYKLVFVITPYNKQKGELLEAVRRDPYLAKALGDKQLEVQSVDQCQVRIFRARIFCRIY